MYTMIRAGNSWRLRHSEIARGDASVGLKESLRSRAAALRTPICQTLVSRYSQESTSRTRRNRCQRVRLLRLGQVVQPYKMNGGKRDNSECLMVTPIPTECRTVEGGTRLAVCGREEACLMGISAVV